MVMGMRVLKLSQSQATSLTAQKEPVWLIGYAEGDQWILSSFAKLLEQRIVVAVVVNIRTSFSRRDTKPVPDGLRRFFWNQKDVLLESHYWSTERCDCGH